MLCGRHVIFILSLLHIFKANGHDWSSWGHWSSCSATCGTAYSYRTRTCLGHPCQGDAVQSKRCGTIMCHGDGGWSLWTPFSSCIVSCGTSIKLMQRFCNNPAPSPGGRFCEGNSIRSESCYGPPCSLVSVIDGKWGSWSTWSACTDKNTRKYRHRICNNPAPNYGGKFCLGQNFESLTCSVATSPVVTKHSTITSTTNAVTPSPPPKQAATHYLVTTITDAVTPIPPPQHASTQSLVTTTTDAVTPSPPARHVTTQSPSTTTTDAVTPSPPPRQVTTHYPLTTTTDAVTPSPPASQRNTQHRTTRVLITK